MKDTTAAAGSPALAAALSSLRKAKRSRGLALNLVDDNNRKQAIASAVVAATPTVCSSNDDCSASRGTVHAFTAVDRGTHAKPRFETANNNDDEHEDCTNVSTQHGKRYLISTVSNNTTASTSSCSYKEALLLHTGPSSHTHGFTWSSAVTTALANMGVSPSPSECGTISAPTSPCCIDNPHTKDNQVSSAASPVPGHSDDPSAKTWPTSLDLDEHSPIATTASRQDKTAAARLHPREIRSAIAHASSQGVLSKSSKREMRQSILRGATHVVLNGLRQVCHLQPLVLPLSSSDAQSLPPTTEFDRRHTNGLHKCLNALVPPPQGDTLKAKHRVLIALDRVIDKWMHQVKTTTGIAAVASLFVGGSFYLKVDDADSDLDVVVLCPVDVTVGDFFSALPVLLLAAPTIHHVVCMEEAYVPTISCTFHGSIHVDLLFSRFTQTVVPNHLPLHSDHILVGLDLASVRSLSVPRVASLVLDLVPNPTAFRGCLRAVRAWAKARGLYSNKVGFLGGISWTVLVALVCQMFPHAVAGSLLHHFFHILSSWQWPMPVMLAKPYDAGHGFTQWSPALHVHDRAHVMPILTPGYPSMNSAANVTHSTLRVLKEELTRGKLVLDDMVAQGLTSPQAWSPLFAPSDFFVRCPGRFVRRAGRVCRVSAAQARRCPPAYQPRPHGSSVSDVLWAAAPRVLCGI
ncbi:hypothetical protein, variant [Aphanomyces invadans]|uniref:polynucleotide adenylyltransferase n=1 Tax=Aphanomyces invadans TaxID=157072 RepID=A0A024UPA3_9STRA|nr:hypothetical protein, variant [Aphanomyces invadans]ETW07682.1 hypothetical protein, variant [Aphanomyces invadans]|eukprot:XP_008863775.1 hypothetical protein, variant [Aphanomyces invadans]